MLELVAGNSLERDRQVLVELRNILFKENKIHRGEYARWNISDISPCNWAGITCYNGRVSEINLRESDISGGFFEGFPNLTELSSIDLSKNTIHGVIPGSLNQCRGLRYLNLSHNIISGQLNLSGLHQLEVLDLTLNRFNGSIQSNFPELCVNLVVFNISLNRFSGGINGLFDRCSKLKFLDLSSNTFSGDIWPGFANLLEFSVSGNNITGLISEENFPKNCSLTLLDLSQNHLYGPFPDSISNCKNLGNLDLWGNKFTGRIPSGIGTLPDLENLFLGSNKFDRSIPEELLNCSKLAFLDLSNNSFGGEIQSIFGRFRQIKLLTLHGNNYAGGLRSSGILNLKNIVRLDLSFNNFSGPLPVEISQMPKIKFLILAYNNFSGPIPPEFGNVTTLQILNLSHNKLSGQIPTSIGNLKSLLWLKLAENSLSGQIPAEIGNCRSLLWLDLANNQLSGKIPAAMSNMGRDPKETFEHNRMTYHSTASTGECLLMRQWLPTDYPPFRFMHAIMNRKQCRRTWDNLLMGYGIIPICLDRTPKSRVRTLAISGFIQLTANNLTGEIPPEIGQMAPLSLLHLNRNKLEGFLPSEISKLPLIVLNLSANALSGAIPSSIGYVRCMQSLDLSRNNFSGVLPSTLNNLADLSKFNVSFNVRLEGVIPLMGQLSTFDNRSFLGNPLIRWESTNRSSSRTGSPPAEKEPQSTSPKVVAFWVFLCIAVGSFGCSVLALAMCVTRRRSARTMPEKCRRGGESSSSLELPRTTLLDKGVSFSYLDIVIATRGFSEETVIGRGGFGVVYGGALPGGRAVAVKELQSEGPEGEREFQAEMEVLCAAGKHPNLVALLGWCLFGTQKLLVYEYMEGGSLEGLISDWSRFGWERRLSAAVGVARALVFLHHECVPAVVHRDVKASNVLLYGAGRARVTDFGLARVMRPGDSHVSTVVAGTVGYVAPEYAQTWQATTKGDVYSFGVLVMELATGRRALDKGDECLVDMVRGVKGEGFKGAVTVEGFGAEAMGKLLEVGLRCTAEVPLSRPSTKQVLEVLQQIRPEVLDQL